MKLNDLLLSNGLKMRLEKGIFIKVCQNNCLKL